jgi:hypothetical protein
VRKASQAVFRDLLVVIPHSSLVIPGELPLDSLSDDFPRLARNVDWYTNWLYDFRDVLNNQQLVFQVCSLIVECNRHPDNLDESVPLIDVFGEAVYKPGKEPDTDVRRNLAEKYSLAFHKNIDEIIGNGTSFLLDGHSTITARGMKHNQIDLMNYQYSSYDKEPKHYCPDIFLETYAQALQSRLPNVKVTTNASEYYQVYGHICAEHSINAMRRQGTKVPSLSQETNDSLYRNPDGTVNIQALNRLRRAFAESLLEMKTKLISD